MSCNHKRLTFLSFSHSFSFLMHWCKWAKQKLFRWLFCQYCVLFYCCHTFAMNIHRIILTRFGRMSKKTGARSRASTSSIPFCAQTIRNIWNESSGYGMCNINWKLNGKCEMQLNVFPNNKLPFVQVSDLTQNTYLPINFHVVCTFSRAMCKLALSLKTLCSHYRLFFFSMSFSITFKYIYSNEYRTNFSVEYDCCSGEPT